MKKKKNRVLRTLVVAVALLTVSGCGGCGSSGPTYSDASRRVEDLEKERREMIAEMQRGALENLRGVQRGEELQGKSMAEMADWSTRKAQLDKDIEEAKKLRDSLRP